MVMPMSHAVSSPLVRPSVKSAVAVSPMHAMQCMEVWGGNGESENGVAMPGLDAWVLAKPSGGDAEGGDIHYVSSCGTGRITRMMIADVSGHGVGVSKIAGTLRNLMRRYVNYVDQREFFKRLNTEFGLASNAGMFATAIVMTYWAPTDCLVLSNAGHPAPIAFASRRNAWFALKGHVNHRKEDDLEPSNLPLGVIDESSYEQIAVRVRVGDMVVVYTDSLVEARLPDGSMLGEAGLLDILRTLDTSKPAQLARALFEAVMARTGGRALEDDATIMVLRPNGLKPAQKFSERMRAMGRFVGMIAATRHADAPPIPWPEAKLENLLGPIVPSVNRRWQKKAKMIEEWSV